MSKQETSKKTTPLPDVDLQRLAAMARHAYEQRHLKNCIAITKALLLVDPEHAEARVLQSLIQSDIRQDLDKARALLEDVDRKDSPVQYEKAAQIVLWRVFNVDPANEEASALLSRIKTPLSEIVSAPANSITASASETRQKPVIAPEASVVVPPPGPQAAAFKGEALPDAAVVPLAPPVASTPPPIRTLPTAEKHPQPTISPDPLQDAPAPGEAAQLPETSLVVEEVQAGTKKRNGLQRAIPHLIIPIAVAAITVIGGLVLHSRQPFMLAQPKTVNTAASSSGTRVAVNDIHNDAPAAFANNSYAGPTAANSTPTVPTAANSLPLTPNPTLAADLFTPRPDFSSAALPADANQPPKRSATLAATKRMGKLAIGSPTSTDIYAGDKYLGSAPVTLELSQGTHTLEYRHQDQRKLVKHVVKANQTTMAMVTFEVAVQINARPWAQVFLEGDQRRLLGQTPLGSVQVPIGSVLVFENPNFPAKNYRVTGKETAIQIVFP